MPIGFGLCVRACEVGLRAPDGLVRWSPTEKTARLTVASQRQVLSLLLEGQQPLKVSHCQPVSLLSEMKLKSSITDEQLTWT